MGGCEAQTSHAEGASNTIGSNAENVTFSLIMHLEKKFQLLKLQITPYQTPLIK